VDNSGIPAQPTTGDGQSDPGHAAEIVWATNAAEMYQLLVRQRGWSPQRYQRYLADTWRRLLLAD
jgi:hypothetical protein